jgi:RNA polymerase sigma-70 factor (ECF subfamily)
MGREVNHREASDYREMSDAALVRRARHDAGAFDEFYARTARRVWSFFEGRTHDAAATADLTAETYARAWGARRRFSVDATAATPWLFGIARNVLLESVRRARLERTARERLGMAQLAEGPAAAPHDAWLEGLDDAVRDLPADQQEAVRLRFDDDLAYSEIARRLEITPVAARTRVYRGLSTLRERRATHSRR